MMFNSSLLIRTIDRSTFHINVIPLGETVVDNGEDIAEMPQSPRVIENANGTCITRSKRFLRPGNVHACTAGNYFRYGQKRISHIDIPELENNRGVLLIGKRTYVTLLGATNLKLSLGP